MKANFEQRNSVQHLLQRYKVQSKSRDLLSKLNITEGQIKQEIRKVRSLIKPKSEQETSNTLHIPLLPYGSNFQFTRETTELAGELDCKPFLIQRRFYS